MMFGYLILEMKIFESTLPAGWNINLFMGWRQDPGPAGTRIVRLSAWVSSIIGFLFKCSLPFIFWLITYFRLKEKEV
jgi:hypothetical protein